MLFKMNKTTLNEAPGSVSYRIFCAFPQQIVLKSGVLLYDFIWYANDNITPIFC